MRKREEHRSPSGVRGAGDFREHLIIDLHDPVVANMCASRVRCARPAAREARANIRAEVINLGNWKRFTRHQDKAMSKRDEDIERREAIKKHQAAVEEGAAARRRGMPISANPYRYDPITYTETAPPMLRSALAGIRDGVPRSGQTLLGRTSARTSAPTPARPS
jgi:hypothetical protein